jgi:protocatechuate 3,4-dioxygenase beta subunit
MRVPVVLLLILAGVAALILALFQSPEAPGGTGVALPSGGEATVAAPTAAAPARPLENAAPGEQPVRQAAPTATPDLRVAAGPTGASSNRLDGQVLDPEGLPVAGALLTLRDDNGLGGSGSLAPFLELAGATRAPAATWTAKSGADGRFTLTGMQAEEGYTLIASAEGFAPKELAPVAIRDNHPNVQDVHLDAGFTVHGFVRDGGTGAPLVEAQLLLVPLLLAQLPEDDPKVLIQARTAVTDNTGYYRVGNVSPGMMQLTARASGYGSTTYADLSVAGESKMVSRDFNLQPGVGIAGEVLAKGAGPLEGVRVTALSLGGQQTSRGSVVTGRDGRFEIRDLIPGAYTVLAQKSGWAEERQNRVEAGDLGVRIELVRQGAVEGQVLLASGTPANNFTVALRALNPHTSTPGRAMRTQSFKDQAEGRFQLAGVQQGSYLIEASAEGFAPCFSEQFEVRQSETTSGVLVQLNRGGAIVGRVVDSGSGAPIVGARITTYDNTFMRSALSTMFEALMPRTTTERVARSDEEGFFELDLLKPDVYQIQVEHSDYTTLTLKDIRVEASETPVEVANLRLSAGARVVGTVHGASGDPLTSAQVTLTNNPDAPGLAYQGRTDSRGRYEITRIQPGRYVMHATRPTGGGENPFIAIVDMQHSKVDVYLREGQELVQDLYLQ